MFLDFLSGEYVAGIWYPRCPNGDGVNLFAIAGKRKKVGRSPVCGGGHSSAHPCVLSLMMGLGGEQPSPFTIGAVCARIRGLRSGLRGLANFVIVIGFIISS